MHGLAPFNVIGPTMLHKLIHRVLAFALFILPHSILRTHLALSDISLSEDRQYRKYSGSLKYDISLKDLSQVYKPSAFSS